MFRISQNANKNIIRNTIDKIIISLYLYIKLKKSTMKTNKKTIIEQMLEAGKKAKEIAEVTNAHIVYIYQIKSKLKKQNSNPVS